MKVLCFSPNDAVLVWAKPQAQVLKALKDRGDTIDYAYCDRTITDFCMSMASSRVSFSASKEQKDDICKTCVEQSSLLRGFLGVDGFPIHRYVQAGDRQEARRISEETPIDELADFQLEGVPIGKFAYYEAMIQTKSLSADLDETARNIYRAIFKNCYLITLASARMVEDLRPDIGLTYHAIYSYNRCFSTILENRGIAIWSMNASCNVAEIDTHLILSRSAHFYPHLLQEWARYRDVPVISDEILSAGDHIIALMEGRGFGYSNPQKRSLKTVDERLGIKPGRKVLAAALSSHDELMASQRAGFEPTFDDILFPTQIDWIKWLFEYARGRDDIHLVIRVHPREFKKGINGKVSPHVELLNEAFLGRPENVSINVPEDRVSNYELLMRADAVTVAWSSVAQEAALLGIPAVTFFDGVVVFPIDLTELGLTSRSYRAALDRALAAGWSLEISRRAFRWAALMFSKTRIDMTNGARSPIRRSQLETLSRRVLRKLRRTFLGGSDAWSSLRATPSLLADADRIYRLIDSRSDMFFDLDRPENATTSPERELAAIRAQLARISHAFHRSTGAHAVKLEAMLDRGGAGSAMLNMRGEEVGAI
jgi:hypothetical protein